MDAMQGVHAPSRYSNTIEVDDVGESLLGTPSRDAPPTSRSP